MLFNPVIYGGGSSSGGGGEVPAFAESAFVHPGQYYSISSSYFRLESVTTVHRSGFMYCNIDELDLPNCLYVAPEAFPYCSFRKINLPKCRYIDNLAFSLIDNNVLTELNIPACEVINYEGLRYPLSSGSLYLEHCAFVGEGFIYYTGIQDVNLPNCMSIHESAFDGRSSYLRSLRIPKCQVIPTGFLTGASMLEYVDVTGAENIGRAAFASCSNLQSVDMHDAFYIDYRAFDGCTKLSGSLVLPSCYSILGSAFYSCYKLEAIHLDKCRYISSNAFVYCSSLSIIEIPEVDMIEENAFAQCKAISSLSLPAGIVLESYAFYGCSSLRTVFNKGRTYLMNRYVFDACPIQSVYIPSTFYSWYMSSATWSPYRSMFISY